MAVLAACSLARLDYMYMNVCCARILCARSFNSNAYCVYCVLPLSRRLKSSSDASKNAASANNTGAPNDAQDLTVFVRTTA